MTTRIFLLAALLAGPALSDEIYAKQGTTPMATGVMVLEEKDGKVFYLDMRLKTRKLALSMVGRVEKKRCLVHDYKDKEDAARTADDFMALAKWAEENKFHADVIRRAEELALAKDPEHEGANVALGRVQHNGEWMTPAEAAERRKEEEADAKRAAGLVEYKGEWVTPEDKARLEKGLVKFKGEWMTVDEMKRRQGYVMHDGQWVKKDELEILKMVGPARKATGLGDQLQLVQTPNCAVMGDLPPENLKQLADSLERLFAEWHRLFPGSKDSDMLAGKYRLFAFKKNRPYQKLVKAFYEQEKKTSDWSKLTAQVEEARYRQRLKETSTWYLYPNLMSIHVQMPDPFEGLKAHCIHFAANVLCTRYPRQRFPTWWLNEGLAYYLEKKVAGSIQTFNVNVGAEGGYANQGPADGETKNPWVDASSWNGLLTNLVRTGRDPQLEKIKGKVLYGTKNRLDHRDIAKAASVVEYLILNDAKKFAVFFQDAKTLTGGSEVEREVAAMLKHYGNYRNVEDGWRKFALNGFRIAR